MGKILALILLASQAHAIVVVNHSTAPNAVNTEAIQDGAVTPIKLDRAYFTSSSTLSGGQLGTGSTNYIQNRNTLQQNSSFYTQLAHSQESFVDGLGTVGSLKVNGPINLPLGATNYLDVSASTQTKSGGLNLLGWLGIGTNSPTSNLHVVSSGAGTSTNATVENNSSTGSSELISKIENGAFMLLDSEGSAVAGTFAGLARAGLGRLLASGLNALAVGTNNSAHLVLVTNGAERIRVDSGGFVGINNSSPQYGLDISSNIRVLSGIYEVNRSTPAGHWVNRAYSGANFTANGAMTWTVDSSDVVTDQYMLLGKTLFYHGNFAATSVGGTPNTTLKILIPGGFTAAQTATSNVWLKDAGNYITPGYAEVNTGGGFIMFFTNNEVNFTTGTDNTQARFQINFEIQ